MIQNQISVVLPVFNEESIIEELAVEIEQHVESQLQFVFVDDGSTDRTLEILKSYQPRKAENSKKIVVLSRNFGHQKALMAGLSSASKNSQLILVLDADFQDDPKDIPVLIEKLEEGYDCVYAVRTANSGNFLVNILTGAFYKIQDTILSFNIPRNAGTFSIFNTSFLHNLLEFKEGEIYFPGLRAYVGKKQTGVPVTRQKRAHGKSKVGTLGLFKLAIAGLVGFSALPMRAIFLLGVLTTLLCIFLGFVIFLMKITGITQIPGITTLLIFMLGLFGIQIMFIGIVGEYLGKLFLESKKRPRWLVREIIDDK
jgi:glycosyltransferase involved in cell wall biosynthesis